MQILIIEDEKHIADGLKFNLEAEGYDVLAAESAEDGAEALKNGVDAIVLDVMLP
jgi:two-component system alkaline phosphatase synthesis response regulator PhoP